MFQETFCFTITPTTDNRFINSEWRMIRVPSNDIQFSLFVLLSRVLFTDLCLPFKVLVIICGTNISSNSHAYVWMFGHLNLVNYYTEYVIQSLQSWQKVKYFKTILTKTFSLLRVSNWSFENVVLSFLTCLSVNFTSANIAFNPLTFPLKSSILASCSFFSITLPTMSSVDSVSSITRNIWSWLLYLKNWWFRS